MAPNLFGAYVTFGDGDGFAGLLVDLGVGENTGGVGDDVMGPELGS